ncbi:SDR family NAD(P)-dependent oxidoreductase [Gryllotalpicola daejeonensis]|uniref:SDR family NAD(P)-dependent oxidoreductase n=1 Tax=Gryllotalpicola daejeonensis TaxID=993087 RepID=A0ABP7ZIQ2_9MICO
MELNGVSAVVTGAASGLGAATVAELTSRGVHVLGLDLDAGIEKMGSGGVPGAEYVGADVTSEDDVTSALARLDDAPPLRLVVNCAGIAPAKRVLSSSGPHPLDLFRRTIEVNLVGTFNVLRLAAARIAETEPVDEVGQRGLIVNTASVAAYEGQIGQAAYSASKGGVVGLTITAARDLSRNGIRVCTIAPGIVDTPMLAGLGDQVRDSLAAGVPFPKRLAQPREYAQLVVMLAQHDYLNGETIRMDAALRMQP